MCIYRRVEERMREAFTPDDNSAASLEILNSLSPEDRAEWQRRAEIIVDELWPRFNGDIDAAIDEFERMYPNAA